MADETPRPALTSFPDVLLQNFRKLTPIQRVGSLALLALAIAVIPALALMGREPDMAVLFSNLDPEDAQAIVATLNRQGIAHEVNAAGDTIKVPAHQVHDLRLQLASQGLPEVGGVGFEIFDQSGFGITQFVQQMNYRRALQGELARTIAQIDAVERVRVHLVLPERRLFSSQQEPARAAVVVTLKRGARLKQSQVDGIVHLVASSVEGLEPGNVTVVDSHGRVLSQSHEDEVMQLSASQLEVQRHVEKDLEQRVQTMLDRVLGLNKSVVRVSAQLEFRHVEVTEEQFDPENQVVRSEQRSQEKVIEEQQVSGVPGVRSNVPDEAPPNSGGGPKEAKRKSETINYEVNRKVSKVVEPQGTIRHLSVAVLVDGTYEPAEGNGSEEGQQYIPRSEEEMEKLVAIVKKAVGFSQERGDQIEVVNIPFESTSLAAGEETLGTSIQNFWTAWGPLIKPAVFLLLGLAVVLFVVRPMATRLTTPPPEPIALPADGLPTTVSEYEAQMSESPEEQAIKLAAQNPATAAFVIRSWIKEEQQDKLEKV
ncbi:MAG: flagellar M-ring protein FliF [Nitrospirae bacterium]|nr:MAG: flagellar M-ring protein FliF [Nitrospirota bacterium]